MGLGFADSLTKKWSGSSPRGTAATRLPAKAGATIARCVKTEFILSPGSTAANIIEAMLAKRESGPENSRNGMVSSQIWRPAQFPLSQGFTRMPSKSESTDAQSALSQCQ